MTLAADYPFLDVMWTMLVFFLWVLWFWLLIIVAMGPPGFEPGTNGL